LELEANVSGDLDFLELDWPTQLEGKALARWPEHEALSPAPADLISELCTNLAVTLFYGVALFAFVKLAAL
jgi:hypothetical protein